VSRVSFYENGVVSVNLPIRRQVIGTMATRTTHPLFLNRLQNLLTNVAGRGISVDNPFAWMTKAEVVNRLRNLGGADLIAMTTSCSSVRARTTSEPLCGCCSQCLDRRFAVLAAGLAEHDPENRYEVRLFLGSRRREQDRTMAQDWTRHAARFLSDASPKEFAVAFGAELSDIAAGYPSRLVASVVSDTFEMHRRHGEAVRRVVEMEIRSAASAIVQEVIPSDSLMAALLTSALNRRPAPVGLDDETEVEAPLSDGDDSIFPLRLVFGPFLRGGVLPLRSLLGRLLAALT
jgi:hypothetical protein